MPKRLQIKQMKAEGDCLFDSIEYQIYGSIDGN